MLLLFLLHDAWKSQRLEKELIYCIIEVLPFLLLWNTVLQTEVCFSRRSAKKCLPQSGHSTISPSSSSIFCCWIEKETLNIVNHLCYLWTVVWDVRFGWWYWNFIKTVFLKSCRLLRDLGGLRFRRSWGRWNPVLNCISTCWLKRFLVGLFRLIYDKCMQQQ